MERRAARRKYSGRRKLVRGAGIETVSSASFKFTAHGRSFASMRGLTAGRRWEWCSNVTRTLWLKIEASPLVAPVELKRARTCCVPLECTNHANSAALPAMSYSIASRSRALKSSQPKVASRRAPSSPTNPASPSITLRSMTSSNPVNRKTSATASP